MRSRLILLLSLLVAACASDGPPYDPADTAGGDDGARDAAADRGAREHDRAADPDADPDGGLDTSTDALPANATTVLMDFTRSTGFFAAPFPDESRRQSDGRIDTDDFPPAAGVELVRRLRALAAEADGFGTTSTIYLPLSGDIDEGTLPSVLGSVAPAASVVLVGADPDRPDFGRRHPVIVGFAADASRFGAPHLLSMIPLQGLPLIPGARYVAAATTAVAGADGEPLAVAPTMAVLQAGDCPVGLGASACGDYHDGLDALVAAGVGLESVTGMAVFRTWDPTTAFFEAVRQIHEADAPALDEPLAPAEVFDTYCVFDGTLPMPVFQDGRPPFAAGGGGWTFDDTGNLRSQGAETARIVVTLPRQPMPEGGFPGVVFVRTGGGGDRPLVDRGVRGEAGGEALEAGSGPAREFAAVGFAGVMVDGPHGGPRNVTSGDEQLLVFAIDNPAALRDNLRQSALELTLVPDILETLRIDASTCPGLASSEVRVDTARLALMGHSMGATIAPLVLGADERYGLAILSGAGGSWLENVMHKESPLHVRPIAELILGYPAGSLRADDPALMLMQWVGEPAQSPVFGDDIRAHGQHVLMLQGIVDTYILPPIANATSLALALDLAVAEASQPLDETDERLAGLPALSPLLVLSGAERVGFPVSGNRDDGGTTAVVVQYGEDGVEDGHEVAFQTEAPKRAYRCFLESWLLGTPHVIDGDEAGAPCMAE